MNETDWIDDIKSQIHDLHNEVYLKAFNSLLLKGILVADAKCQAIEFVETCLSLSPGTFKPTVNLSDSDFFES